MKIPLQYQRTEYDCGPTSLLNAVSFLFAREEIPPDILRYVMMYTLDSYNDQGEACKNGTSQMAIMFLANWLSQYATAKRLPIACEYRSGERVRLSENSELTQALRQGGAVVVRLHFDCWHYVTLTGLTEDSVLLFDPYYTQGGLEAEGIAPVADMPCAANRRVAFSVLNQEGQDLYAMGPVDTREAVLLFNTNTRQTPESTIEYFL
ncbi:MAG: C39 family peptidase [Oscillospiraceae bacterium]|nr:C39 family peptidase [Oscillospiraceae bacterium]